VRVGIDYLPATSHAPGAGRYSRELVRALIGLDERPDLALFDVGRAERTIDPRALGLPFGDPRVRRVTRSIPRRALPFLAAAGFDASRLLGGVDVFHHVRPGGPPVRRARQVLAIAELPDGNGQGLATLRDEARRMSALVVFCADWRVRVAERLSFPIERIHVTPVGCEHWRRTLPELPTPDDPPRILVLGATRAERRPLAIFRAFERVRERGIDARLVIAGRAGPIESTLGEAVRASAHGPFLERILDPCEADLPALVARSSALVHLDPSAGTPVTPLEALASGVPVVLSRIPCFTEHLDGLAEFVDDAEAVREPVYLAAAVERALTSRVDGLALAQRAARAREFTWARCARSTFAVWRTAST